MKKLNSIAELKAAVKEFKPVLDLRENHTDAIPDKRDILVCGGTGCTSSDSLQIIENLKAEIEKAGLSDHAMVHLTGCFGFCAMGPIVKVYPDNVFYVHVKPEDAAEIVQSHIANNQVVERLLFEEPALDHQKVQKHEDMAFYKKQLRIALRNCCHINPEDITEYIANDGYLALAKCLEEMTPQEVIEEMKKSGLRGRGGAGFPTGRKWAEVAKQPVKERYVVCNGDEGDPGAFMDRSIMEGDPHKMIEGMIIGAYLVGAQNGYIYVRAEYPLAVERLKIAIAQAEERGLLGDNILGSGFNFRLHINRGAGAFVCGEGSALTASIEGNRGMPRVKPPRSAEKGLFERPTVLNNVETYANVPMIIANGSDWYRGFGTEGSPGTKAFALTGSVNNTGLIEVPMGTTLREIVYDIGGGVKDNVPFKAVQIGGPSGGCLVEKHLDLPLDFDSVKKLNAIMGSGGLVVMDENSCMVDVARFFMSFTQRESCGKCTPCRIGTKRMLEILDKITEGKGTLEDLDKLEETANTVRTMSLCGLGKSAPLPVISTLELFRHEYEEHIVDGKCRAHVCSALKTFKIDPDKCKGCTKCARNCPVGAITGEKKEAHVIDTTKCIKCGACMEGCKFDAIYAE